MSPRPKKDRNCNCPFGETGHVVYKPAAVPLVDLEKETVDHDEIEAVFLCDGVELTQEEAGRMMGVSRGTVQRLVSAGRQKIINSIVAGKALVIDHGKGTRPDEEREKSKTQGRP